MRFSDSRLGAISFAYKDNDGVSHLKPDTKEGISVSKAYGTFGYIFPYFFHFQKRALKDQIKDLPVLKYLYISTEDGTQVPFQLVRKEDIVWEKRGDANDYIKDSNYLYKQFVIQVPHTKG